MNATYTWTDAADAVFAWHASKSRKIATLAGEAVAFLDAALTRYAASRWTHYRDVEDLTQGAWLRILRALKKAPAFTRDNFRSWFYGEVRFGLVDAYRTLERSYRIAERRRRRLARIEDVEIDRHPAADPDESAARSAFRELTEGLPEREAIVLELRFLVGWELHEIGDAFGITTAGAGNIVYAATKRLRSGQRLRDCWRSTVAA